MTYFTELPPKPPASVAQALSGLDGFVWLDSELSRGPRARWSVMAALPDEMALATDTADDLFDQLRSRLTGGTQNKPTAMPCPYQCGWLGYMAYDFSTALTEWNSRHKADRFQAAFGFYSACLVWDHETGRCGLLSLDNSAAAGKLLEAFAHAETAAPATPPLPQLDWLPEISRATYIDKIARVQAYIAAGDIYQANLSQGFLAKLPEELSPFMHYLASRKANPAPFSAYLDLAGTPIGSTSPERFITVTDGTAEARPIKGTIAASDNAEEDEALRKKLSNSTKDRAENIMIVDLLRNDFSRVCKPHSVNTPQICGLESYEGLHHLVSSVTGELKDGKDTLDLVAAAFPGGSITGAPKLRAMEIIDELEDSARGVYCGSIGYLSVDGTLDLSIAIRTLIYENGGVRLNVGGGITRRSDPASEYDETLVKAAKLMGGAAS